jgi:hypothetical protein
MYYPKFMTRERALLLLADHMLELHYDFRDMLNPNTSVVSRRDFETLSIKMQKYTDAGLFVFIRMLNNDGEFGSLILSSVPEEGHAQFLEAFKTVPESTDDNQRVPISKH